MNNDKGSKSNLFNPDDALLYGTAFKSLYEPYKNLKKANVKLNNEKERLMFEIQKYAIMAHDLGLYLDVYPNDKEASDLRSKYLKMYEEAKNKYESKYPPYNKNSEMNDKIPFPWSTTPFPWGDK